jgi:hypothetical protein
MQKKMNKLHKTSIERICQILNKNQSVSFIIVIMKVVKVFIFCYNKS